MVGLYTQAVTDYQDWQSFPTAQSDNLFPAFTQTLPPGQYSTDVLPAVNWSSITLMVTPTAGAARVQIIHLADQAGTQVIGSDVWQVKAGTNLVVRTPLRGRFVQVHTHVTSAVALTAVTWATLMSAASDRISFPVSTQNLSDTARALAANGVATYDLGEITAGLAYFYFKPYDATGKLSVVIHAVDELGNPGPPIADFGTPAAIVQQLLTVPDLIVEVKVTNTDGAAAHTYDFSLTIPPQ